MLAMIAPAGLVVCVASNARFSRSPSSRPWPAWLVRASTSAPWVYAGSALCALVTMPSAPAASACGGRSGWKPRCAAQAASTSSGTPARCAAAACPARSPVVPT